MASELRVTTIANNAGTESVDTTYVVNGSAKAWVNFNGSGTIASRDSLNLSSLSDNGTGQYEVAVSSAFGNSNYGAMSSCSVVGSYPLFCQIHSTSAWSTQAPTTTEFAINSPNYNASGFGDPVYYTVTVHGDLA